MNPCNPGLKYPHATVKYAQAGCLQEKDNTEFLIQHKTDMYNKVLESIEAIDTEFGREPIIVGNGIILPSPIEIFEHEAQYHAETLEQQKVRLAELIEAEKSIDNALRRCKLNNDYKFERFLNSRRQRKPCNNSAPSTSYD